MHETDSTVVSNTKNILNAIPSFVFAVDEDVRIIEYNDAGAALLKGDRAFILNKRGGEALHCIHSDEVLEGCGKALVCKDCVIRNSVNLAYTGQTVTRNRAKIEIRDEDKTSELFTVITASPLVLDGIKRVLLIIEDISELLALQDIVPICMKCKKVRGLDKFWTALESYFNVHWGLDFSHGYCPDCAEEERQRFKSFIVENKMK